MQGQPDVGAGRADQAGIVSPDDGLQSIEQAIIERSAFKAVVCHLPDAPADRKMIMRCRGNDGESTDTSLIIHLAGMNEGASRSFDHPNTACGLSVGFNDNASPGDGRIMHQLIKFIETELDLDQPSIVIIERSGRTELSEGKKLGIGTDRAQLIDHVETGERTYPVDPR